MFLNVKFRSRWQEKMKYVLSNMQNNLTVSLFKTNQVNIFVTTVIPGKVILLVILGMDMLPDSPNPDLISDPNVLLSTAVSSCGRLANPMRFVVAYFNFSSEPKSNIVEILQKNFVRMIQFRYSPFSVTRFELKTLTRLCTLVVPQNRNHNLFWITVVKICSDLGPK